jgi:hypothetical protein
MAALSSHIAGGETMNRSRSVAIVVAAIVAWGTAAAESVRLPASTDFTMHWYSSLDASPLAADTDFTVHWYPEADDGALTIARVEPLAGSKR